MSEPKDCADPCCLWRLAFEREMKARIELGFKLGKALREIEWLKGEQDRRLASDLIRANEIGT